MPDALHRLALLESILGAVNLGAIVLDEQHRIVLWNHWMARHSGRQADAVLGQDFFAVFPDTAAQAHRFGHHPGTARQFPVAAVANPAQGAVCAVHAWRCRGGHDGAERMQQAIAVTPINLPGSPRHCLIQINDVTIAVGREKLLREQTMVLRSQTFSDGLTGIANRRHFDVAIEKEMRRAMRTRQPAVAADDRHRPFQGLQRPLRPPAGR